MKKLFNVILACNKTWLFLWRHITYWMWIFSFRVTIPVCSTLRSRTSLSLTTWPSSALGSSFPSCRSFPEIRRLSRLPMVCWWTLCSDSASPRQSGPRLPGSWTPWGGWRFPCVAWTYPQVNRHTLTQTNKDQYKQIHIQTGNRQTNRYVNEVTVPMSSEDVPSGKNYNTQTYTHKNQEMNKYSDEQTICTQKNKHSVKHKWTNTTNTCTNKLTILMCSADVPSG